jgi:hypothetical protein
MEVRNSDEYGNSEINNSILFNSKWEEEFPNLFVTARLNAIARTCDLWTYIPIRYYLIHTFS